MNMPDGLPFHRGKLAPVSLGFLWQSWLRAYLHAAGYRLTLNLWRADAIVVWGRSHAAMRGLWLAKQLGKPVLTIEDAFIRSINPGPPDRFSPPPAGLLLDEYGIYFDAAKQSALERQIDAGAPDAIELARAERLIERIKQLGISKYNSPASGKLPDAPYILVIDQTFGDKSVAGAGADAARFEEMLRCARAEHPDKQVLVKLHPESLIGRKAGYFEREADHIAGSPAIWPLLAGATAIYTVSSQLGFEAILADKRPVLFGVPFYAGWGLSDDRYPVARRAKKCSKAHLAHAAYIRQAVWFDPHDGKLCTPEQRLDEFAAEHRRAHENAPGFVCVGMRLWKRAHMNRFLAGGPAPIYRDEVSRAVEMAADSGRSVAVWAGAQSDDLCERCAQAGVELVRVEDGFIRSRGLGAALVPPVSLVFDRQGIYYDPTRASDLETLLQNIKLDAHQRAESVALRELLHAKNVSKYNLTSAPMPELPKGERLLVIGQVENDASIRLGTGDICTNGQLLQVVRAAHPKARIIYKPHPDVEAGLRPGALSPKEAGLADIIADNAPVLPLIDACDALHSMTSLAGFEALLRGKQVVCYGRPFYAGWGLSDDQGQVFARRNRVLDIDILLYASLIAYPRYLHPKSGMPASAYRVVQDLGQGGVMRPNLGLRSLAKLQGMFASFAHLWR